MDRGYVRLWRKSIDSGLIKNHNIWIFWTWCLMKANHRKDYKQTVGFQEVFLQPGDFIFGRKMAAEETELSEQNIRTCLTFLKKAKNLTIKSTNKFSVISITNWATYQHIEKEINQQINQHVTSNQPASNHKQEHKNNINKNTVVPDVSFKPTAEKIYSKYIEEINPKLKTKQRAVKNIENWLKRGRSENDLILAYKNYSESMSQDPAFRKNPANFYGINEDFAFDFLPINNQKINNIHKIKTAADREQEEKELFANR